jgi:predicted Zn-dependent peptidase
MNTHVTRLSNGLRVVTQRMPQLETAALGVWVKVGTRHETDATNGISHLLEHMAFKGTETRTARGIVEAIEQVGGDLNAATSLETTAYFARVLAADVDLAVELMADILQHPKYAPDDLEREREVILQEIAGTKDSPDDVAYDLLNAAAYPDQPVGRPILGSAERIQGFQAQDVRAFLAAHYAPADMVLSAAGAVDHSAVVKAAERWFGGLAARPRTAPEQARYVGGATTSEHPFEQAHLLLGYQSVSYRQPEFYTAQVLSGMLGGGMSSRLFQSVREEHGLCYSIYAGNWSLDDTGLFSVHLATGKTMLGKAIDLVLAELSAAAATAAGDREIDRAKAQLKAGLLMSLESASARAEQLARQVMLFDRIVPPSELVQRVDAVTPEAVRALAEKLFSGAGTVAIVGAGRKGAQFARQALSLRTAA